MSCTSPPVAARPMGLTPLFIGPDHPLSCHAQLRACLKLITSVGWALAGRACYGMDLLGPSSHPATTLDTVNGYRGVSDEFHPSQYMPWHVLAQMMLMQIMSDK